MFNSKFRLLSFLRKLFNCCLRMGPRFAKENKKFHSTELSENEIKCLLKSTDMTREQIIEFHESFLKDCPNGYLTKKDFVRMFKSLHSDEDKKEKCDKFAEYVFNAFEEENVIKFTDFVVCYSVTSLRNLKDKIELAFKIYDIDKNHVIDRKEMFKVLEALFDLVGIPKNERTGSRSPKVIVDSMMEKMDLNRNNVLELDEFIDGCANNEMIRKVLIDPMFNC